MPVTSATGSRRNGGFTLLELLVVMAIVALLASAFPFALNRALPSRRVAATAQKLVVALNDARAESSACSCPVRVGPQSVSIPSSTRVTLTDADGHAIEALEVFPDGSSRAGRFEIVDGHRRSAVTVSELTGRIALAQVQ